MKQQEGQKKWCLGKPGSESVGDYKKSRVDSSSPCICLAGPAAHWRSDGCVSKMWKWGFQIKMVSMHANHIPGEAAQGGLTDSVRVGFVEGCVG
jgi:hypothetical protein